MKENERNILNFIRWLSAIAIVMCHICQENNNRWAWVLNIGVQVFFFLSGFLYGGKGVDNPKRFFINRAIKIYIPYLIWVVISCLILYMVGSDISISAMYKLLFFYGTGSIRGLEHLWFMKVIFICYLILPVIDNFVRIKPLTTILCLVALLVALTTICYHSFIIWVALYYIGYFCGKYPQIQKYSLAVSLAVTILLLAYGKFEISAIYSGWVGDILHASFGILIVVAMLLIGNVLRMSGIFPKILAAGGAYELYLIHPLPMMFITPNSPLNLLIVLTIISIATYILFSINKFVQKRIKPRPVEN